MVNESPTYAWSILEMTTAYLFVDESDQNNEYKSASLYRAAEKADVDLVLKLLLGEKADPNVRCTWNKEYTPLHIAACSKSWGRTYRVMRILLDKGANVNAEADNGERPLHMAALCRDYMAVVILLEAGADPNVGRNDGKTPLSLLSSGGHSNTRQALLDTGADPGVTNNTGGTSQGWTNGGIQGGSNTPTWKRQPGIEGGSNTPPWKRQPVWKGN
jgi:ankyrin repeat protein